MTTPAKVAAPTITAYTVIARACSSTSRDRRMGLASSSPIVRCDSSPARPPAPATIVTIMTAIGAMSEKVSTSIEALGRREVATAGEGQDHFGELVRQGCDVGLDGFVHRPHQHTHHSEHRDGRDDEQTLMVGERLGPRPRHAGVAGQSIEDLVGQRMGSEAVEQGVADGRTSEVTPLTVDHGDHGEQRQSLRPARRCVAS